uniref:Uncharacterized protein n=1 Tax=Magallana gigas TaxID=29159 RepID=K1PUQ4_MAGGI
MPKGNSKTNKRLDLFELFRCGPEVTEGKMKPNKHIFNQILNRRDEQLHHFNNEYKKLNEEVMNLRMELGREKEKCKKLEDSNKHLAEDRDQFKDRFSKLAETKLTAGNAHIQDLSDMNRPQKLGEKLSELYDNEWTDAFEDLRDTENLDEKSIVQKLLEIFKTCVSFCQLNAEQQEMSIMESVRKSLDFSWTEKSELCNGSLEDSNQDILSPRDTKILKDLLKTKAGVSVSHVKKMFLAENPNYAALGENVQAFINGCLEVCWLSAIQDPPLAFDWNFPEGSDVADKVVKLFTKSGTKVDFVVWPVMKLHVDGDILSKGMGFPPVLVLLSVAVTATVAADPPVYCQVDNNEYYMRQWGQCKACDRCPYGFGLNSKISVDVDPVYGALKCRGCLKCTEGETFKSTIGYEECQRSQEVPSERELQGLCDSIADNNKYARLGRELGVKDNDIQRIKEEQNSDLLETSFQTLKRWREMKGKGATKGVLRQALRNVGLPADILKDDP